MTDVQLFQTILQMTGVTTDEKTAALIMETHRVFAIKKGGFSIDDATEIREKNNNDYPVPVLEQPKKPSPES